MLSIFPVIRKQKAKQHHYLFLLERSVQGGGISGGESHIKMMGTLQKTPSKVAECCLRHG